MTLGILAGAPALDDERTVIEDWFLGELERYHRRSGGYLASLDTYNGELNTEEGLEMLAGQAMAGNPFMLVAAGQANYGGKSTSARKWEIDTTIEIYCGSSNLRSQLTRARADVAAGAYQGDTQSPTTRNDPGVRRMLCDIRNTCLGRRPFQDGFGTVRIVRDEPLIVSPQLTVWRVLYNVPYSFGHTTREQRQPAAARSIEIRHNLTDDGSDPTTVNANPLITQERERP